MTAGADVTAPPLAPEELEYRRRTLASARCLDEAREHLPGGDSRSTLFYRPCPAVFVRGDGCRVTDLDGNELVDFTSQVTAGSREPRGPITGRWTSS